MILYDSLKIFHILSATLLLTSLSYSIFLWKKSKSIPAWILVIVISCFMLQLMTGFTLIDEQHYSFSERWIRASVVGFMGSVMGFCGFLYALLYSPQNKKLQSIFLFLCIIALLMMIFFMVNKIK